MARNKSELDLPFSKRHGEDASIEILQYDNVSEELKIRLWNMIFETCFLHLRGSQTYDSSNSFDRKFWGQCLKMDCSTMYPLDSSVLYGIRDSFMDLRWDRVIEAVEFVAKRFDFDSIEARKKFISTSNMIFQEELSGYRFIEGRIYPIASREYLERLEETIRSAPLVVSNHLRKSLELLSNREDPDLANSMKESISAVEAICKLVARDEGADLHQALKAVEKKMRLNPALKKAYDALYGYSSSNGGIRHATIEDSDLNLNMALFFQAICSDFVWYLFSESSRIGLDIDSSHGRKS